MEIAIPKNPSSTYSTFGRDIANRSCHLVANLCHSLVLRQRLRGYSVANPKMGFLSWLSLDRSKRGQEEMDKSVSDATSSEMSSGYEEEEELEESSSFESSGDGYSSSEEETSSDSVMQNGKQVKSSASRGISNRRKVELRSRKGQVRRVIEKKGPRKRITKVSKRKKPAVQTGRKVVARSNGGRRKEKINHHDVHGESHDDEDLLEMKKAARRVKSLWKVRPLPVDEKIRVFIAGRDDGCSEYDGGDFYEWCKDCEAGRADAMEAGAYPLVIQDTDLRPILEIKYPSAAALRTLSGKDDESKKRKSENILSGIKVPSWKLLSPKTWPESCLSKERIPIVHRTPGGEAESAVAEVSSIEEKQSGKLGGQQMMFLGNLTEPEQCYIRYMQPTPDDLDQAIEYDMDDEDEVWLAKYNKQAKAKNRTELGEEWLEHLMDRMEKEYTAELQKHPEKWILKTQDDRESEMTSSGSETMTYMDKKFVKGIAGAAPPPLVLPSISELFPLKKCLQVSGLNHDVNVIRDVYKYWKEKHERAGRPLIQRLWYEPPWHRKASEPTDANLETDDVFSGYDMPSTLFKIRKRNLDKVEVQNRFDLIRRDLEMARTLADQVRRREKLKKQEAVLLKEEWACRMRGESYDIFYSSWMS